MLALGAARRLPGRAGETKVAACAGRRHRRSYVARLAFAPYRHRAATELTIAGVWQRRLPRCARRLPATSTTLAALYEASYGELPLVECAPRRTGAPGWPQNRRRWRWRIVVAGWWPTPRSRRRSRWRAACRRGTPPTRARRAGYALRWQRIRGRRGAAHRPAALAAHLVGTGRAPAGRHGADPCRAGQRGCALAGVVDLPPCLRRWCPRSSGGCIILKVGSRYAGWAATCASRSATERITLACYSGQRDLTIDGSRPADLRAAPSRAARTCTAAPGYRSAADLRATGSLACDDTALGLIDVLFPCC